jgi:hypothetical protein
LSAPFTPIPVPALVVANGGQTLTITPEAPAHPLTLVQVRFAPSLVSGLGNVGVTGIDPILTNVPLRFTFGRPVSSVTFLYAGSVLHEHSPVVLAAYDAANALVGTFTTPYSPLTRDARPITAAVSGTGASYFVFTSGGPHPNSLIYEIAASTPAVVAAVPEPTAAALLAIGLLAVGGATRRGTAGCRLGRRERQGC